MGKRRNLKKEKTLRNQQYAEKYKKKAPERGRSRRPGAPSSLNSPQAGATGTSAPSQMPNRDEN